MKHNQALETGLRMWANYMRGDIDHGYPKVAAGFDQYIAAYREPGYTPLTKEVDMLRLVERGMGLLRLSNADAYRAMCAHYEVSENRAELERVWSRDKVKNLLKEGRTYLQALIDYHKREYG